MTKGHAHSLQIGDKVLCTKDYDSALGQGLAFKKGKVYTIGGEYYSDRKNSSNLISVVKNELGVADGWHHSNFIKLTNKAARVLY